MEGLARKLLKLAPLVARHALAAALWLLLLPLLTSLLFQAGLAVHQTGRLPAFSSRIDLTRPNNPHHHPQKNQKPQAYFLPSLAHAPALLWRRCFPLPPPPSPTATTTVQHVDGLPFLVGSTLGGWVLCGAIVAASLAALGVRDAVLPHVQALFEADEEEAEEEEEGVGDGPAAVPLPPPVPPERQPQPQHGQGQQQQGQGEGPVDEWGIPMDLREAVGLQGPLKVCF